MAEYIEREAALRVLCDACGNAACPKGLIPRCSYYEKMQSVPAAVVRPVVLCRDCKWTKTDGMDDPAIYCVQWDRWEAPPDGFCWLGEKREDK